MEAQNYANHRRFVPIFHFFALPLIMLSLIGSIVNLVKSVGDHERLYSASLLVAVLVALMIVAPLARVFALRAQDRAIRAEENLRHYVLTGKLLDSRLTMGQIIGLRFASDAEFPALAKRAADENLSGDAIKKAVKNWRADNNRA